MFSNVYWRSGFICGIEGREISNRHSTAFLDGYDYATKIKKQLEDRINAADLPLPANFRSEFVRGILRENRLLKETIQHLEAKLR